MSLVVTLVAIFVILSLVGWSMEHGGGGVAEAGLIAALGAVAAAGRVVFVAVPSVAPFTVICLLTGASLGARAGAAVGAIAALVSNTFLGQGPWTQAQMALWAAVGASGGLLRHLACNVLEVPACLCRSGRSHQRVPFSNLAPCRPQPRQHARLGL
mgnify:CR=1 FL=1